MFNVFCSIDYANLQNPDLGSTWCRVWVRDRVRARVRVRVKVKVRVRP